MAGSLIKYLLLKLMFSSLELQKMLIILFSPLVYLLSKNYNYLAFKFVYYDIQNHRNTKCIIYVSPWISKTISNNYPSDC